MSQDQIEDILSKYPEGLTTKEIQEKLKIGRSALYNSLRRLEKRKAISITIEKLNDPHGHYQRRYRRI